MTASPTVDRYQSDDLLLAGIDLHPEPQIRVYPYPEVAIVLGHGSKPEVELDLDAVKRDPVPVLKRRGGGCAVLLDPGNVIVSVVMRLGGLGGIRIAYERITDWLISALARVGIAGVARDGISDLVLEERKIGGSCIYRSRDLLYYSTTILVDPNLELVERYLAHPPREPGYRKGRSHREFLGSLVGIAGVGMEIADFARHLEAALRDPGLVID